MGIFSKKPTQDKVVVPDMKPDSDVDEKVSGIIQCLFDKNKDPSREMLERTWERNVLYMIGEQYHEWSGSERTFRSRLVRKNQFVPTPIANIIRDYVKNVTALIMNKTYEIRIWPNSVDLNDVKASELGADLLRFMDTENDAAFEEDKEWAAIHLAAFGTAFLRVFHDGGLGKWIFDAGGNKIKTGDVATEAVLPFCVYVPPGGDKLDKKRYVGIQTLKEREWVEDVFGEKIAKSSESSAGNLTVEYQKRLMRLVANVSPWKGSGIATSMIDVPDDDLVVFQEVEFRPTPSYPNGRYVVAINGKILKQYDEMPIPVDGEKWYYSLTDFHYNKIPGNFWSDSGINDLISPQNSTNSILQGLEMNRRSVGQPMIMGPKGFEIVRKNAYGMGYVAIEFDPLLSGGSAPAVHDGRPLPRQVLDELQIHKGVAQDAAGDPKNILRGQSPGSQASGALADSLREAAEMGHSPDIKRFYRSLKRVYKKRLVLAASIYTENRMLKIAGRGSDVKVIALKGSDLRGNTDVRLEIDTNATGTKSGQNKMLAEVLKSGVLQLLSNEPELKREILMRYGITNFKDKTNVHVERAENENARLALGMTDGIFLIDLDAASTERIQGGQADPQAEIAEAINSGRSQYLVQDDPLFKFDNHKIHAETHTRWILSDEFKDLPERIKTLAIGHNDIHIIMAAKEEQASIQMQLAQAGRTQTAQQAASGQQGQMERAKG